MLICCGFPVGVWARENNVSGISCKPQPPSGTRAIVADAFSPCCQIPVHRVMHRWLIPVAFRGPAPPALGAASARHAVRGCGSGSIPRSTCLGAFPRARARRAAPMATIRLQQGRTGAGPADAFRRRLRHLAGHSPMPPLRRNASRGVVHWQGGRPRAPAGGAMDNGRPLEIQPSRARGSNRLGRGGPPQSF